jgi:plasmid stabilization system protein ParE
MKAYVLTARAKRDVFDIWEYVAKDNLDAADRIANALERAFRKIARNPGIGHWRPELADRRYRFYLSYSYLIVYRSEERPLQVIRVLHAARDVQRILSLTPRA